MPGIPHRGTASREREASFQFRDGKIIRHTDRFGFYRWARQAFGIPGLLLGWTGWFRARVRAAAGVYGCPFCLRRAALGWLPASFASVCDAMRGNGPVSDWRKQAT
ncbi:MAG: hypothetical protein H6559_36450 [Lewinellaceae bacterium]|nr:hypothetical protein [Lewinellaceae bacterium]